MLKIISAAILGLMTSPAFSDGATSSGGGNTINNVSNPWFLENTPRVQYCVLVDETNMGIDEARAKELARDALDYWKRTLAGAPGRNYQPGELAPYSRVQLGTQDFVETDCTNDHQLRFQFGVLQGSQAQILGDPRQFVGIAMRMSYDAVNLRGKGFIYISPQAGPLRPTSNAFAAKPWEACNNCILSAVLKHEVGHIFGIKHNDSRELELMRDEFPAIATLKELVEEVNTDRGYRHAFEFITNRSALMVDLQPIFITSIKEDDAFTRDLFRLTPDEIVLRLVERGDWPKRRYVFEAKAGTQSSWSEVGELCIAETGIGSHTAAKVYVDANQKVFSKLPTSHFYSTLDAGSVFAGAHYNGKLCSSRGAPEAPLYLDIKTLGQRDMATVKDGVIRTEWLTDSTAIRSHL